MIQTITPSKLSGTVAAIPSKSMAHRLLICAALAGDATEVVCGGTNRDIEATRACLAAMKGDCVLPVGESGSTLRFLLPVAAALGLEAEFHLAGRLPDRPLYPLDARLEAHGVTLTRPRREVLRISGQLTSGDYVLPGNVSSQYVSGLLLALPLLSAPGTVSVTGTLESAAYVEMTLDALRRFGVSVKREANTFHVPACGYTAPARVQVEGDWSNAAFWLCAGALGAPVTVTGLNPQSLQGDRAILELLTKMGAKTVQTERGCTVSPGSLTAMTIDAAAIPDLVPVLAVVAAAAQGTTRIIHAQRLRLKESDRIASVTAMLTALGGRAEETADGLLIHGGKPLTGGTVDSCNDHRIAMAAAVASVLCTGEVTVLGAEAVEKSYPGFWNDFARLKASP